MSTKALSGTGGNAIDSWLFLQFAFGSQAFFLGQCIGKAVDGRRWRLLPATALET